jgi:hypothetical protein
VAIDEGGRLSPYLSGLSRAVFCRDTFSAVSLFGRHLPPIQEMKRVYNRQADYWCIDQASHNHLLWRDILAKEMSVTQYAAEDSHLCTFGDYRTYNVRVCERSCTLRLCEERSRCVEQGSSSSPSHLSDVGGWRDFESSWFCARRCSSV